MKEYLVILKFKTDEDAEQLIDGTFENLIDSKTIEDFEVIEVEETK